MDLSDLDGRVENQIMNSQTMPVRHQPALDLLDRIDLICDRA
jgi:hypothetical protein